jgi:uncharacterized membrane protein (DUF485 family)
LFENRWFQTLVKQRRNFMDDLAIRLAVLTVSFIVTVTWFVWAEQNKLALSREKLTTEDQVLVVIFLGGGAVFLYMTITLTVDFIRAIMEPFT